MKSTRTVMCLSASEAQLQRSSLVSLTKRESLSGSISSRRNSQCSIIETSEQLVLVECKKNPLTNLTDCNHTNINDVSDYVTFLYEYNGKHVERSNPSSTSSFSLDIDTNIRQMEETQARIQNTLDNLWKLKDDNEAVFGSYSNRSRGTPNPSDLQSKPVQNKSESETSHCSCDKSTFDNKDMRTSSTNSPQLMRLDSVELEVFPLKRKVKGLLDSVKNAKYKTSNQKCNKNMKVDVDEVTTKDPIILPQVNDPNREMYIVKELVTSEREYVKSLELVCTTFKDFVRGFGKSFSQPEQDRLLNFTNIQSLCSFSRDLLREFEKRLQNWNRLQKISDIFIEKRCGLSLYTTYLRNFTSMISRFQEFCKQNTQFGKIVKMFEKQEQCRNLKIEHFLLKPVQRLPQYRLLLEDYLKHLQDESSDYSDTRKALQIVSDVLKHANDVI